MLLTNDRLENPHQAAAVLLLRAAHDEHLANDGDAWQSALDRAAMQACGLNARDLNSLIRQRIVEHRLESAQHYL